MDIRKLIFIYIIQIQQMETLQIILTAIGGIITYIISKEYIAGYVIQFFKDMSYNSSSGYSTARRRKPMITLMRQRN